jgi:hypothetical protein
MRYRVLIEWDDEDDLSARRTAHLKAAEFGGSAIQIVKLDWQAVLDNPVSAAPGAPGDPQPWDARS